MAFSNSYYQFEFIWVLCWEKVTKWWNGKSFELHRCEPKIKWLQTGWRRTSSTKYHAFSALCPFWAVCQIRRASSFLSYAEQRLEISVWNATLSILQEHWKLTFGVKLVQQVLSIKNNNEVKIHFKLCQTSFSSHGARSDTCFLLRGFIEKRKS